MFPSSFVEAQLFSNALWKMIVRTRQELVDQIKATKIKNKDEIEASILPAVRIFLCPTEHEYAPIGASRVGGNPDLPSGFSWPAWDAAEDMLTYHQSKVTLNRPLDFIAQINLEQFTSIDCASALPERGMLYFFYDIEFLSSGFDPRDAGSAKVFYFDAPIPELKRTEPTHTSGWELKPCAMSFVEEWTINNRLDVSQADWSDYCDLHDDGFVHRLLGNPYVIQNEMEEECQLVTNGVYMGGHIDRTNPRIMELQAGVKDWRLLFQLDSDDDFGMYWGDVGRLYFWIRNQDLAARNFDKTWLIMQCC